MGIQKKKDGSSTSDIQGFGRPAKIGEGKTICLRLSLVLSLMALWVLHYTGGLGNPWQWAERHP